MKNLIKNLLKNYQLRFWVKELNPLWTKEGFKGKIINIKDESHDVKSFYLKLNDSWAGFLAGQYVNVCVEVNGVKTRRCYSITSDPKEKDTITLTVKRVKGGKVSNWMHDNIKIGDILELGYPSGDFILQNEDIDSKFIFIMGGSGITPGISILRDLKSKNLNQDIIFIQACKTKNDILFNLDLTDFCNKNPNLKIINYIENEKGFLTQDSLKELVPDLYERKAFMCGPSGMMESLKPIWENYNDLLKTEVFLNSYFEKKLDESTVNVTLKKSNKIIKVQKGSLLLDELEKYGIDHPYGCRMGICNTCLCLKNSGETENMATKETSSENETFIKPCITYANTDLKIDI